MDGDTIEIGSQAIRIHGIDAPETGQKCQLPKGTWNCSRTAIDAMAKMTAGKTVRCVGHEFDDYGRLIARCATDGEPDIGAKLVPSGLAWAFIKYSADYIDLEMKPRRQKIGIWQSKTQPPWEYRARRWETAAQVTPEKNCPIKGNISAKGERIYHVPWSKHYARTKVELAKGERWFCTEPRSNSRRLAGAVSVALWLDECDKTDDEISDRHLMTGRDLDLLRRYRSPRPLGRELLLAGMAAATFVLWYFDLTPYPATNMAGLGWGLLIGAVVSYTVRLSRR